jgi:hypothetical protein
MVRSSQKYHNNRNNVEKIVHAGVASKPVAVRCYFKMIVFPFPVLGLFSYIFPLNLKVRMNSLVVIGLFFWADMSCGIEQALGIKTNKHPPRSLSDFADRNEKSTGRGQIFVDLRANSTAICRKYTGI